MVCIAAFIILCLIGFFVLILSIWKPEIGKKYLKVFKKAWGCVGKRLTLRKCETNFKEDIKNSILRKFIIKKPKLVKPISYGIEVLSVVIVIITVLSLIQATKSGLSLYVLGTCNVSKPDSCLLGGTDVCTVRPKKLNWFEEWGAIFEGIPDRIKKWDANDYINEDGIYYRTVDPKKKTALEIFDPICNKCMISFKNQLESGFFDKYNVAAIPYPAIGNTKNSYIISTFILATNEYPLNSEVSTSWQIITKLFIEKNEKNISWQDVFSSYNISEQEVYETMIVWLKEIGYSDEQIEIIKALSFSQKIKDKMDANEKLVIDNIRIVGVPTIIYNGKKHTGVYKK